LQSYLATLQSTNKFPFEVVPPTVSGITWAHRNGRSSEMYLPESVGVGCGFIDYDNDGALDVLVAINDGQPLLHRNRIGQLNHWAGPVAKQANSDAIGALIT
jgi:hypothetical protein